MNMNIGKTVLVIVLIILAGMIGLAVGILFNIRRNLAANFSNRPRMMRSWNRFPSNQSKTGLRNTIRGQITAVNGDTVTVQLLNGASQTVQITNTTTIDNANQGTKQDLQNGKTVQINGITNSDGSINATTVLVNPPTPVTTSNQ